MKREVTYAPTTTAPRSRSPIPRDTRLRAEGHSRSAANQVRPHQSRSNCKRARGKAGGCFGVVGPKRTTRRSVRRPSAKAVLDDRARPERAGTVQRTPRNARRVPVTSRSGRGRSFGLRPGHWTASARNGDETRATGESEVERAATDHGHAHRRQPRGPPAQAVTRGPPVSDRRGIRPPAGWPALRGGCSGLAHDQLTVVEETHLTPVGGVIVRQL